MRHGAGYVAGRFGIDRRPMNDLLSRLATDSNVLIHQIDPGPDRVAVVALSDDQIRNAAFLDGRALTPQTQGCMTSWNDVAAAAAHLPQTMPMMIFHVGHCGSTLISKLIEAAGGPRGMREPLPLRVFAAMEANLSEGLSVWSRDDLHSRMALFLRSCAKNPATAVKATSICNNLIAPALTAGAGPMLFVYVSAETYVTAMLGGENAHFDIYGSLEFRLRRLRKLCEDNIGNLTDFSLGEMAAICWACETATAAQAIRDANGAVLTMDFDRFLKTPAETLSTILAHFGAPQDEAKIQAALSGPLMRQYSKAPEHQFSPDFRAQLLAQYRREQGEEIDKGLAWLENQAGRYPAIAEACRRFGD